MMGDQAKCDFELVQWEDAAGATADWINTAYLVGKCKTTEVVSCGFIVQESAEQIILEASISYTTLSNRQVCADAMVIPKAQIRRRTVLRKAFKVPGIVKD